jgi:hypothetical protein
MASTDTILWNTKVFEFDSGKYLVKDLSERNQTELKKRLDLLQIEVLKYKKQNYTLKITIQGSESQVPNPDPYKLPGSLALARSNELSTYIRSNYPDISNNVKDFQVLESLIGLETWNPPQNSTLQQVNELKGLEKYKKDQFIKIDLISSSIPIKRDPLPQFCDNINFTPVRAKSDVEPELITVNGKPAPFLLYQKDYSLEKDLKEGGELEIIFNPYYYPDALKVEIINSDKIITQTGFIPLFVLSLDGGPNDGPGFFRRSNFNPLIEKFSRYPEAIIWKYLPKIPKNDLNTWKQSYPSNTPNMFDVSPELSKEELNNKYGPNPLNRPLSYGSNFVKNYQSIEYPAFNYGIKNEFYNPSNDPIIQPVVVSENGNNYKKLVFNISPEEIYIKISAYGFVKDTVFDFKARCTRRV